MIGQRLHRPARGVPDDASLLGLAVSVETDEAPVRRDPRAASFATGERGRGASEPAVGVVDDSRSPASWFVRAFGRSFDGERRIGAQLSRLARRDPRWRYLSAVPAGIYGAHIDHLVIGPGGVYTVDARSHPGSRVSVRGNVFRVDGAAYPYVSNSRHEALRAARCLSAACGFGVDVVGVVALTGAEELAIRDPATDVHIIDDAALRAWFRRREPVLDAPTLAAVYDAARRATTWNPES
jgi:hypothetical protein